MKPIVVIDDDADVRDVFIFALENEGHRIISYENGRIAYDALTKMTQEELPCLIIVDYLMPEMNGAVFIQKIKSEHADTLGKIPIAITSAMGSFDPILQETPEVVQLHKPIELDELLQVVKRLCA
ncbi:MAG: response regulator [Bacteriovoracia bacterium]